MTDQEPIVNTNSEVGRYIRAVDQYNFENDNLKNLKGKSWAHRWSEIRSVIFNKHNPKNSQELTSPRETEIKDYPSPALVNAIYRPALERLTDDIERNLSEDPNEKDKGFRLAVINYVLGITMHPAIDGNGQSFRLLALSYIQEHCPEYKDRYFPIKYSSDPSETRIHGWTETEIHKIKIGYPEMEFLPPEDVSLLNTFINTLGINKRVWQESKNIPQEELAEWTSRRREELVEQIFNELGVTTAEVMLKDNHPPPVALARYIGVLLSRKYPGYVFEMFPDQKHKKQYLLTVALTTPHGIDALKNYISTGTCKREQDNAKEASVINVLDSILKLTELQLQEVLKGEPVNLHKKRHQHQVLKRRM